MFSQNYIFLHKWNPMNNLAQKGQVQSVCDLPKTTIMIILLLTNTIENDTLPYFLKCQKHHKTISLSMGYVYRLAHGFSCTSLHISHKPSYISPGELSKRGPDIMRVES